MSKVILICGKICSGKSYYANIIKEKENAVILSTDEVTFDLTNNEQGENYDAFACKVNNYLRKKAVEIANVGCNVILDWGFWSKKSRKEITQFFKDNKINYEWHYVDIDLKSWQENIKKRNELILNGKGGCSFYIDEGLVLKLISNFEEPALQEMDVVFKNTLNK